MDYFPLIAAERRAVADMLDGLSPQQWETQSLCADWTVRQVAAHLSVVLTRGWGTFLVAAIRAGGNLDRARKSGAAAQGGRIGVLAVGAIRTYRISATGIGDGYEGGGATTKARRCSGSVFVRVFERPAVSGAACAK